MTMKVFSSFLHQRFLLTTSRCGKNNIAVDSFSHHRNSFGHNNSMKTFLMNNNKITILKNLKRDFSSTRNLAARIVYNGRSSSSQVQTLKSQNALASKIRKVLVVAHSSYLILGAVNVISLRFTSSSSRKINEATSGSSTNNSNMDEISSTTTNSQSTIVADEFLPFGMKAWSSIVGPHVTQDFDTNLPISKTTSSFSISTDASTIEKLKTRLADDQDTFQMKNGLQMDNTTSENRHKAGNLQVELKREYDKRMFFTSFWQSNGDIKEANETDLLSVLTKFMKRGFKPSLLDIEKALQLWHIQYYSTTNSQQPLLQLGLKDYPLENINVILDYILSQGENSESLQTTSVNKESKLVGECNEMQTDASLVAVTQELSKITLILITERKYLDNKLLLNLHKLFCRMTDMSQSCVFFSKIWNALSSRSSTSESGIDLKNVDPRIFHAAADFITSQQKMNDTAGWEKFKSVIVTQIPYQDKEFFKKMILRSVDFKDYESATTFFSLMISVHNDSLLTCDYQVYECIGKIMDYEMSGKTPALSRVGAWIAAERALLSFEIQRHLSKNQVDQAISLFTKYVRYLNKREKTILCARMIKVGKETKNQKVLKFAYSFVNGDPETQNAKVYTSMISQMLKKYNGSNLINVPESVVRNVKSLIKKALESDQNAWYLYPAVVNSVLHGHLKNEIASLKARIPADHNNQYIFCAIILEGVRDRKFSQALKEFDKMLAAGIKPNMYTCTVILNAYYKLGTMDNFHDWLLKIEREGIEFDQLIYNIILKFYIRCRERDLFLNTIEKMMAADRHDEGQLHSCGKHGHRQQSQSCTKFQESKKIRFTPRSIVTLQSRILASYPQLMKDFWNNYLKIVLMEEEKVSQRKQQLQQREDEKMYLPDDYVRALLQNLNYACTGEEDLLTPMAMEVLDIMRKLLNPNVIHMNFEVLDVALRKALERKHMEMAEQVYYTMKHFSNSNPDWNEQALLEVLHDVYENLNDEKGMKSTEKRKSQFHCVQYNDIIFSTNKK